jgi:hypothetical protein
MSRGFRDQNAKSGYRGSEAAEAEHEKKKQRVKSKTFLLHNT